MAYWVILCLDTEERDSNCEHGVGGCSIPIVSSFGGIAPSRALQGSAKCQKILYWERYIESITGRTRGDK